MNRREVTVGMIATGICLADTRASLALGPKHWDAAREDVWDGGAELLPTQRQLSDFGRSTLTKADRWYRWWNDQCVSRQPKVSAMDN